MWTPRPHVIYLSPLAVPSPESPFLPRDLCMVSPCLGHTIPFSPLLSSPGAHLPAGPGLHILTLSVSTSHPLNLVPPSNSPEMFALAVPPWGDRCTVQMFVHMQPNPEHRTEKYHSSRWQIDHSSPRAGGQQWILNGTRLAPRPGEKTDLFLSSWLCFSRSPLLV